MVQPVKTAVSSLEAGRGYIPEPERITLYKDQHKGLSDKVVGDTVNLEMVAHITEYDETGRYRVELDNVKIIQEKPEDKLIEKAESEIMHIGTISSESLGAIFSTKPKGD